MSLLGEKTEAGLKDLLRANAEDHMRLNAAASYLEKMGDSRTAKDLRDKANVELGHFNAIFSTLIKYEGIDGLVNDMAREETEQHVSEYTNVANAAKAEGHDDIEAMLCAFSEQEKGIAETLNRTKNAF